jgi:hypothetical protein
MADLTITTANVVAGYNATLKTAKAGEAITAGEALYIDTDGTAMLAQHDGTAAEAAAVGISIEAAAVGAVVAYITEGDLALGTILTAGNVYVLSATYGAIAAQGDQGSGDYSTILGVAKGTATLSVKVIVGETAAA